MDTKTCSECGTGFVTRRKEQRFCSLECSAASRIREEKRCPGCGETKPRDAFGAGKGTCRPCVNRKRREDRAALSDEALDTVRADEAARWREWYRAGRARPRTPLCADEKRARRRAYRASLPTEQKRREHRVAYESRTRRGVPDAGLARYRTDEAFRRSRIAQARDWQRRNPERVRLTSRTADAARRVRLAGAGGSHAHADLRRIWQRQNGECVACGCRIGRNPDERGAYHVDHITPVAKGGTNWPRNLQLLCPSCNHRKGASYWAEFRYRRIRSAA